MAKKTRTSDLAARIRKAFNASGLSRFELARQAGISYAIVHRFMGTDRDITIGTASKLCDVLGLKLRPIGKRG